MLNAYINDEVTYQIKANMKLTWEEMCAHKCYKDHT